MSQLHYERLPAPGPFPLHTSRLIAEVGLRLLGGLTTSGEDNIRNIVGPYVQAAPHHSLLDIPALGNAAHRVDRQQLHYIAKDDLDLPGLGWWLKEGGSIFIDRKVGLTAENHGVISDRASKNAAFANWPEGHRYRGPIEKERIMSLVIVPMVFEHNLIVEPVGITGTEPGDLGFVHVAYGKPFTPERVDFEADPEWDFRRRAGMLSKAIKAQLGKDAIDAFMEDLYQGVSRAERDAIEHRRERMAKRKLFRTVLLPLNAASGRLNKEKPLKFK